MDLSELRNAFNRANVSTSEFKEDITPIKPINISVNQDGVSVSDPSVKITKSR